MRQTYLALLALTLLAAGCAAEEEDPTSDTSSFDEAIEPFRYNSGINQKKRFVIKSEEEWATTWASISKNRDPKRPAPRVDFARNMVVVAAMGQRLTGGFSVEIGSVQLNGSTLSVEVRETSPGPACATSGVITFPIAAELVPRTEGEVTFVESSQMADCDN